MNAGLGNLGVSVVQFLSPLVISLGIFGVLGGDAQVPAHPPRPAQPRAARLRPGCVVQLVFVFGYLPFNRQGQPVQLQPG